ncbi:hypothetical protein ACKI14_49335, partial [Streptomyces turgidiscabies]|uniref:hypothetical protein n=1 Tax=Streptomyces turgidiscabies TaxID=85558 RepID=UPI0038F67290
ISHVLGALPPQVPVVRIQSNFAQPWSSHRFAEVLRRRVAGHHGPLFMLSTIPDTGIAAEAAAVYDLILDRNACQVIANNLGEPLNFCV